MCVCILGNPGTLCTDDADEASTCMRMRILVDAKYNMHQPLDGFQLCGV
jgi:hypothetical protein